jgi:hypothetical protein
MIDVPVSRFSTLGTNLWVRLRSMVMTTEEIEEIGRKVKAYEAQLIAEYEAISDYKKRIGMPPCCARHALKGNCSCWQDSWC